MCSLPTIPMKKPMPRTPSTILRSECPKLRLRLLPSKSKLNKLASSWLRRSRNGVGTSFMSCMSVWSTILQRGLINLHRANNAGTQNEVPNIEDLPSEQWRHVFDVNIHSMFYLIKSLIPIMPWGSSIINNASIVRLEV